MRTINWVGCTLAAGFGGCALYPIPDDVGVSKTEKIVRYARCEMRAYLIDYLDKKGLITSPTTPQEIKKQIDAAEATLKKPPKTLTKEGKERIEHLLKLTNVAVVYAFDFDIREKNATSASAGFRFPWTSNVLDLNAGGALNLTRQGHRVFTSEDNWGDLLVNPKRCTADFEQPANPSNFVYPLTGSIGVGRVVETFIDIEEQGGAKDSFVDTLTFTTEATGGADAAVKLAPVPDQFRPVSAAAAVSASRLDIHKLTLSLVFPRKVVPAGGIDGIVRFPGDLNAPFERPPAWRARYNLCVQDARTRENTFQQLRLTDPIVYCITYADQFAYSDATRQVPVTVLRAVPAPAAAPGAGGSAAPRTLIERRIVPRPVRPPCSPPFQ